MSLIELELLRTSLSLFTRISFLFPSTHWWISRVCPRPHLLCFLLSKNPDIGMKAILGAEVNRSVVAERLARANQYRAYLHIHLVNARQWCSLYFECL
jgi:hypothetical protein